MHPLVNGCGIVLLAYIFGYAHGAGYLIALYSLLSRRRRHRKAQTKGGTYLSAQTATRTALPGDTTDRTDITDFLQFVMVAVDVLLPWAVRRFAPLLESTVPSIDPPRRSASRLAHENDVAAGSGVHLLSTTTTAATLLLEHHAPLPPTSTTADAGITTTTTTTNLAPCVNDHTQPVTPTCTPPPKEAASSLPITPACTPPPKEAASSDG